MLRSPVACQTVQLSKSGAAVDHLQHIWTTCSSLMAPCEGELAGNAGVIIDDIGMLEQRLAPILMELAHMKPAVAGVTLAARRKFWRPSQGPKCPEPQPPSQGPRVSCWRPPMRESCEPRRLAHMDVGNADHGGYGSLRKHWEIMRILEPTELVCSCANLP